MDLKKIILYFLPAFIVTCMIFTFSSHNSVESNQESGKVARSILNVFDSSSSDELNAIDIDSQEGFDQFFSEYRISLFNQYLRMFAHMCEFGGLGLMILLGSKLSQFTRKKAFRLTLLWGIIVAICDEILQYFIPGRTCSILDVCKDMIGISGAIVCVLIGSKLIQRYHNKHTRVA